MFNLKTTIKQLFFLQNFNCIIFLFVLKRIQAEKDGDKGEFSPEVTCDMPCSVPSTPAQPYLGSKTKTSFTLKWTVISLMYNLPLVFPTLTVNGTLSCNYFNP